MFHAFAMWVSFIFILRWISPKWRRRIVGHGLLSDISVHVVLQTFFGGDAQGRAAMLLAGVLINLTMHAYRRSKGYERLGIEGWQRYDGKGRTLNVKVN